MFRKVVGPCVLYSHRYIGGQCTEVIYVHNITKSTESFGPYYHPGFHPRILTVFALRALTQHYQQGFHIRVPGGAIFCLPLSVLEDGVTLM